MLENIIYLLIIHAYDNKICCYLVRLIKLQW